MKKLDLGKIEDGLDFPCESIRFGEDGVDFPYEQMGFYSYLL